VAPADVLGLAVGLAAVREQLELARPAVDTGLELVQADAPVQLRVTAVKDVEVDAVEDGDAHDVTLIRNELVEGGAHALLRKLDAGHRLAEGLEQHEPGLAVARLLVPRQRRPGRLPVDARGLRREDLLDR